MVIYSGLITLDYDPVVDVLVTSMPDIQDFALEEVKFCLGIIVDSIKNYDIKNLLLDSSNSIINIEDSSYKAITTSFAMDLMNTRLKRLARVRTSDVNREIKSAEVTAEIREALNLPIQFRNFSNRAEALEWLVNSTLTN